MPKGKSLTMSAHGLSFDDFMRVLVSVPKSEIDKELAREKAGKPRKSRKKKAERN